MGGPQCMLSTARAVASIIIILFLGPARAFVAHGAHLRASHRAPRSCGDLSPRALTRALNLAAMADTPSKTSRVVIVPGNGCTPIRQCNWYSWLQTSLESRGVQVSMQDMPDPYEAKQSIWLPFMREQLQADANSIIVGHSSGAEAAMRFAETYKVRGLVLVAACYTDLGEASEAISGYYDRPWQWDKIKSNTQFITQFADQQDCFIPYSEAEVVHQGLGSELIASSRSDHFMVKKLPELLDHILAKLEA